MNPEIHSQVMISEYMHGVAILRGEGCRVRDAGHFPYTLTGFDYDTSLISSIVVLIYYHSW